MKKNIKISASILSANFACLGEEVSNITKAGSDYIHIDVMDGSFVPNITFGPCVVKDIRKFSNIPFDVHLMVDSPESHIKSFAEAGSDMITFHVESCVHIDRTISLIKSFGKKAGISLVPSTPISTIEYILEEIDLILVMTVNPGFAGQSFLTSQLSKISKIRQMIDTSSRDINLGVDGGININTAKSVISAGADFLVSGSSIFKDGNSKLYKQNIENIRCNI